MSEPVCETCSNQRVIDIFICDEYAGEAVCPDCDPYNWAYYNTHLTPVTP